MTAQFNDYAELDTTELPLQMASGLGEQGNQPRLRPKNVARTQEII